MLVAPSQDETARELRGRLVDRTNGEPVPHYALRVLGADESTEHVETDAEGRFHTTGSHPDGELAIELVEASTTRRVSQRIVDGRAAELRIGIAVGPTYTLTLPAQLGDSPNSVGFAVFTGDPRETRAPVRRDAAHGIWVRFPHPLELPGVPPYELVVEDAQRRVLAIGRAYATTGRQTDPLELRAPSTEPVPEPSTGSTVRGRAVDDAGAALAALRVALRSPLDGHIVARARSGDDGRFAFENVPAGVHRPSLFAFDPRVFDIVPGRIAVPTDAELRIELRRAAPRADLVFEVRDAGGERLEEFELFLDLPHCGVGFARFGEFRSLDGRPALFASGETVLEGCGAIPAGRYCVRVAGHRPAFGSLAAMIDASGRARPIEVALERGWGLSLVALGTDGVALANIDVFVDGRRVGATDAAGGFLVEAPERPQRLRLDAEGRRSTELRASARGMPERRVAVPAEND